MPDRPAPAVSRVARLLSELRRQPASADAEAALARLHVHRTLSSELVVDERADDRGLFDLRDDEATVIRIARGIYPCIPTAEGRVRLLRLARAAATRVIVHVPLAEDATYLGRATIDVPRRLLRTLGVPAAEPGDRFGPVAYTHCFFDEEELLGEIERAGLAVADRLGFTFTLVAVDPGAERIAEDADDFSVELARAAWLVRTVDRARKNDPPAEALASARARGVITERTRGPIGRARLRRAIGWVDATQRGGQSCYRRILLESALDAGAARETVVFGLDVGRTGHVAFEGREDRTFDVAFAIPGNERAR